MAVVLISPPVAKACEPLLGIATLKSWLEVHGIDCTCIDANAEAQDWLLQADRVDDAADRLRARGSVSPRIGKLVRSWRTIRGQLERTKAELRSPIAYADANRYRTAVTSLNRVMGLCSAGHHADRGSPVRATLSDYLDERYCDMDSASVAQAARTPEDNLFYRWFRDDLVPRVQSLKPRVIGLSLIFRNQLLCGAALAGMLRDACPDAHLTLGGELISAWADRYEHTDLLALADSILPWEGEHSLLALARGEPLERVPNACWRDAQGRYHSNPSRKVSALSELPPPDFDGSPWDLYLAPERTAPLVTARGCYWNRCTFCPEVVNPESRLRLATNDQVVRDMEAVHASHGVTTFHFIDSAMPPRTLAGIARHVAESRRPFGWYGFSRLEPSLLRPDFVQGLRRGGCRMLKLGLETASQPLLDVLDKKQDALVVSRILRALRDARIGVHAYVMFGTPFEGAEDAEETLRFVRDHHDCIQFVNCSIMNLAKGSPMAVDPQAHGIREVRPFAIEGRSLDLALYDNFEGSGWGRLGARRFLHDRFLKDPLVRAAHLRTPAHFDANHSVFFA